MINYEQETTLSILATPRRIWYTNRNGNRSKGTGWLPGANRCKLVDVNFSVKNSPYIILSFRRDPVQMPYNESRTTYVTNDVYMFDFKTFYEVGKAFGHEFKEKPSDMEFSRYTWFVTKRFETFIGKEIQVVVSIFKDYIKTDFGEQKMRRVFYDREDKDFNWAMNFLSYHKIDEDVRPDFDMLFSILNK